MKPYLNKSQELKQATTGYLQHLPALTFVSAPVCAAAEQSAMHDFSTVVIT
jgi:hypothetical protein